MNEIFKGMDNAAEQINENFEEIINKKQEDWKTATLSNGWINHYGEARYYKDDHGRVWFEAFIKDGTSNRFFTFPEGYRPPRSIYIPKADSRTDYVEVHDTGDVVFEKKPTS